MQETVNDVMSKKVVAVLPGDTLEEAARLMKEHDVGVLPVVSGGELKGLVTDRDIVLQCGGKRALSGKGLSDYDQGCGQRFSRTDRQRGGTAHGKGADPAAAGA